MGKSKHCKATNQIKRVIKKGAIISTQKDMKQIVLCGHTNVAIFDKIQKGTG